MSDQHRDLSLNEMMFISEYLTNGESATAAYRTVWEYTGNNASVMGWEIRNRPQVKAAIDAAKAAVAEKLRITPERIMAELEKIAFSDPRGVATWSDRQITLRSSDELTDAAAASISSIVMTKHGPKITFHDKRGALLDLGKQIGMFKEKVEHTVNDSLASLIENSFHRTPEPKVIEASPIDRQGATDIPLPPPPPPPPPAPASEDE